MTIREAAKLIPGYDPFATAGDCWFDDQAAQLACDFFPECLRHIEGAVAGQPFKLEPWQMAIVANLFGWKRHDAQGRTVRRYREAFKAVAKQRGVAPQVVREKFGQGRMFGGKEAIDRGMADRIDTLENTIARLAGTKKAGGGGRKAELERQRLSLERFR